MYPSNVVIPILLLGDFDAVSLIKAIAASFKAVILEFHVYTILLELLDNVCHELPL